MSPPQPLAPARLGSTRHSAWTTPLSSARFEEPALKIVGVDPANLAQHAAADDESREAGGPVSDVGVRHAEGNVLGVDQSCQLVGLRQGDRHRLLAHHGDARLEQLLGGIEMDVVGRDDQGVVDPLAQGLLRLGLDQFVVALVAVERVGPVLGLPHGHGGVGVQRSADHAPRSIEMDRTLMRVDDERPGATANEPDLQGTL